MIRPILSLFILLGTAGAGGQPGGSLINMNKPKKPVSVSYEAVLKCYPQLEDSRLSFRVDLRLLSDKINDTFVTQSSRVLSRTVQFRDAGGVLRRVKMENKTADPRKVTWSAAWETLSDTGLSQVWEDPTLKRQNLTAGDIMAIVGKGVIERDESVQVDTKVKGYKLTARRDLAHTLELTLEDSGGRAILNCEDKKEVGSICICKKRP